MGETYIFNFPLWPKFEILFSYLKKSKTGPKIMAIVKKNFNFFKNLHNFRKSNRFLKSLNIYHYRTKFLILESDVNSR